VLDNLSCLTNPEDDNATTSWQAVQELLLAMRRCGVAVIIGHHAGKSGAQRATSRRADILDVILKLTPVVDPEADGRTSVSIEFEKAVP
jgi:putative DNA primase/helicase